VTLWINPQSSTPSALSSLGLSPLVEGILLRRGIGDVGSARAFLHPESVAPVPFPGIERMVERLRTALREKETICVWGDFDVDGQTSTALLVEVLRVLGARVSYHIPIRGTEGHGVHLSSLKKILENGASLLLTCDTGTTAHEAVSFAKARGAHFLITDHHDPDETLPDAYAVINPKLLPESHPLANLAGVGVAYKLAEALLHTQGVDPTTLLDLVALGLIADMASLRAETRALAHRGIGILRGTDRLGLRVLAQQSQADLETLTEETIGFVLAPRLNALGRLSDANLAVELLLSQDPVRVQVLVAQIEGLNTQRRLLTEQVYQAVDERITSDASLLRQPILMLEHASWPAGVLGIVASRLVERYRKPAILLTRGVDEVWHGSGRSIDGLHITQAIAMNREMLLSFGGHPMAAGLSIRSEQLPQFRLAIQRTAELLLSAAQIEEEVLHIDQWTSFGDHSLELAEDLEQLAPFGVGNPIPVLATRDVQVRSAKQLGPAQEHRKLVVVDPGGAQAEVLWWSAGKVGTPTTKFDIAYSMRPMNFQGERRIALTLIDIRMQEEKPIDVTAEQVAVIDLRRSTKPALPPDCLVWAEGAQPPIGVDRFRLRPARQLAIWTSPPGRAELLSAIAAVRPQTVYLIGRKPDVPETLEEFLTRLAGMTKYALRHHDGHTKISELASACAQKELTVRIGLEWLAAGGHVNVKTNGDAVELDPGSGKADRPLQAELAAGVRSLIEESAAYRAFFQAAQVHTLIQGRAATINPG